ncbi:hypothetical protein Vadar_019045 [Vaccinium darrowii]|uniref:Uncharacterized protein n=1 Tax=Vaccinium darrowii TaxID=229202 RepID=A0ACB7X2D0_9ERIC|nr:hypothetical protein Vadar_019045 [Vaccinium darrowii]
MENYSGVAPNKFVLKPINHCKCQGCERKLMKVEKLSQKILGVHSTSIDASAWQVTISGTVNSQQVVWLLKRKVNLSLEEIPPPEPRQGNYFPPPEPAASYAPSAPPWPYDVVTLTDHRDRSPSSCNILL